MTLSFDPLMVIGLCLIPGAFVVAFILGLVFSGQELGAVAVAVAGGVITFLAGAALFLVGLGMEIR